MTVKGGPCSHSPSRWLPSVVRRAGPHVRSRLRGGGAARRHPPLAFPRSLPLPPGAARRRAALLRHHQELRPQHAGLWGALLRQPAVLGPRGAARLLQHHLSHVHLPPGAPALQGHLRQDGRGHFHAGLLPQRPVRGGVRVRSNRPHVHLRSWCGHTKLGCSCGWGGCPAGRALAPAQPFALFRSVRQSQPPDSPALPLPASPPNVL